MSIFTKRKTIDSTPFSKFIREAHASEKKRVYTEVLKKASERQNAVIDCTRSKENPDS